MKFSIFGQLIYFLIHIIGLTVICALNQVANDYVTVETPNSK